MTLYNTPFQHSLPYQLTLTPSITPPTLSPQTFANDPVFQQQLKNPKVSLALDLWGGSKAESQHTSEEIDEVRRDLVVKQVYPRMKELESACSDANIFFPIDYVRLLVDRLLTISLFPFLSLLTPNKSILI